MNYNYILQMLAKQNPQIAQMLNMVQDGKINIEQVCRSICQQRGIDINSVIAQAKQQQNGNKGSRQPYNKK